MFKPALAHDVPTRKKHDNISTFNINHVIRMIICQHRTARRQRGFSKLGDPQDPPLIRMLGKTTHPSHRPDSYRTTTQAVQKWY
jgi:hypothetical protein